jgi:prophage antirepressor-like protein
MTPFGQFLSCCDEPLRPIGPAADAWFVADQVCLTLGLEWRGEAVRDVVGPAHCWVETLRGPDGRHAVEVVLLDRAGVFELALTAETPHAAALLDWVCEEVLPAIDETGMYIDGAGGVAGGGLSRSLTAVLMAHEVTADGRM